jgi:hypothetical protein
MSRGTKVEPRIPRHLFSAAPDEPAAHDGRKVCSSCAKLGKPGDFQHPEEARPLAVVELPELPEGAAELDARILGEGGPDLRADAKVGPYPGVRLSFKSKFGPLSYMTDEYGRQYGIPGSKLLDGWQANVRAIALSLQALRAVDRYGVTRKGEQYRGWTPIAPRPAPMTRDQAAMFIAILAEHDQTEKQQPLARFIANREPGWQDLLARVYKRAAKRAHPDTGGDHDTMSRLNAARELLDGDR